MKASRRGIVSIAFLLAVVPFLAFSAPSQGGEVDPTASSVKTSRYVFQPEKSTIQQSGGFAGVNWTYAIEGQFCLAVDPNAGAAWFARVDANALDVIEPARALDPNQVFNMAGLTGTVIDETSTELTGQTADGSSVLLTLTLDDDLVYLTGETTPPPNSADFFVFTIDAVANRKYAGGTGDPNHPYQIATAADLMALGESPDDYDKHFTLTNDIDLGRRVFDKAVIAPDMESTLNEHGHDPYDGTAFTGIFDGSGYAISHLTIEGGSYLGMFGQLGSAGKISNLGLEAADVNATGWRIGGVVCENDGGTVTNCYTTGTVSGEDVVGGLVGYGYRGSVTASYSTATVTGDLAVGGLVGYKYEGTVVASFSAGTVTGRHDVGGLVGRNWDGSITSSHSTGTVTGDDAIGGLVGYKYSGRMAASYSSATVNGKDEVGGLVGVNYDDIAASYCTGTVAGVYDVGGLVGQNWYGDISTSYSNATVSGDWSVGGLAGSNFGRVTNCYSTGLVSGVEDVGGVVGRSLYWQSESTGLDGGYATACFWDTETSAQAVSEGGEGLTTAEMLSASTFLKAGWDFVDEADNGTEDIWWIDEGQDYPRLWWEPRKYAGGAGEPNDPYQIATAADLIALGESPDDYDKHFILTADIDLDPNLPGRRVFDNAVIAGSWKLPFTGVFDGNGHTISHLTIVGEYSLGLFGQLGWNYQRQSHAEPTCTVTNLAVEDVNIVGSVISAGALAAYVEWAVVSHSRSTGKVSGKDTVGGLVGHNRHAVINCYSGCTVAGDSDVGGLVGSNNGSVMDCYSTGTVNGGSAVGGLVGRHRGSITQSYSTGAVSGKDAVGGLVGRNGIGDMHHRTSQPGDIDRSYSTAAVKGETCVGGLIGEYRYGSVRQCYSTGAVSGNAQVGGLVSGPAPAMDVTVSFDVAASFWDVETSGLTVSSGGQGKTTTQMQTVSTFLNAGWDFVDETDNGTEDIWWIDEGQDYPRLWWEPRAYGGGTGEPNDPYLIYTGEHLAAFGAEPNDWDRHVKLMADIDLAGQTWSGPVIGEFNGVFDSSGRAIANLEIVSNDSSLGLFGGLGAGAQVTNLCIVDANITSLEMDMAGILAARNDGLVANCYAHGTVSAGSKVGGLVGSNGGSVVCCGTAGHVDAIKGVGRLVGRNTGSVDNSYSTASVSGWVYVAGLVGDNAPGSSVTNSYSAGPVTDCPLPDINPPVPQGMGGLVGHNQGRVVDGFWDVTASGLPTSAGGDGKSTAEMQMRSTFLAAGWDFTWETANSTEDIWRIDEGQDYPRLWWEAE